MDERRQYARTSLSSVRFAVSLSASAERPLPDATAIDASVDGLLLAFPEPVGLIADDRVVVSIPVRKGRVHTLATVSRVERGDDFRTYVAITLQDLTDEMRQRLVDGFHHFVSSGGDAGGLGEGADDR